MPEDVRRIAVTRLDLDHADGLGDFPDAEVHVLEEECNVAARPVGFFRAPSMAMR
jgi:glyoxylase-like metal-dependent hydrolase (beta-lactamase superfamily II)